MGLNTRFLPIASILVLLASLPAMAQSYLGIDSCGGPVCHGGIRDKVLGSQHPDKVLDPDEVLQTDGTGESAACGLGASIFDPCTSGYDTYVAPYIEYFNFNDVEYALGKHWKQRFLTAKVPADGDASNDDPGNISMLPLDKFVMMGIQWNIEKQRWENYHGPTKEDNWYETSRYWNTKCGSCHTTGFNPETDFWVEQSRSGSQHGVTCEGCHGPAGNHNPFGNPPVLPPFPENFPGGVDGPPLSVAEAERRLEVCGQCHGRGASVPNGTYGYPWKDDTNDGYIPGEVLADYYEQTTSASRFWPDGTSKSHHQQYIDFLNSTHWNTPNLGDKLDCITCHLPHETGVREGGGNALCQTCHTDKIGDDFLTHTGGGLMSESVLDCSDCHMPFTAKSINKWDIQAHTFRIIEPANTLEPSFAAGGDAMPNSCTSTCHSDGVPGFPLTPAAAQSALYNIRFANGDSKTEIEGLTMDRSNGDLVLMWDASTDGNHQTYRVYRTTDASSAVIDADHWVNVTFPDGDDSDTNTMHTRPPSADPIEFFLIVDRGSYGFDGPWGHYFRVN